MHYNKVFRCPHCGGIMLGTEIVHKEYVCDQLKISYVCPECGCILDPEVVIPQLFDTNSYPQGTSKVVLDVSHTCELLGVLCGYHYYIQCQLIKGDMGAEDACNICYQVGVLEGKVLGNCLEEDELELIEQWEEAMKPSEEEELIELLDLEDLEDMEVE